MTTSPRPGRRPGPQSRQLILAAARQLFVARGFAATGTREIAAEADLPERLIYRHFGTKRQLFDEAARAEIADFLNDFVMQWRQREPPAGDFGGITSAYVSSFLDFSRTHGRLFADLIGIQPGSDANGRADPPPFVDLFGELEELAVVEARRYGLSAERAGRSVRFTFALVVATALLSDVLYRGQQVTGDEDLVGQLTEFILGGALG